MKTRMKTKANRSKPTAHQLELKAKYDLTDKMFEGMLKMLEGLSPEERATLKDQDFITEDEADLIYIDREPDDGPTITAEELFAEEGYTPRRRRA
jgi:hypothetical protein